MQDGFKIKGYIHLLAKDVNGNVITDERYENLIVNSGKAEVINLMGNVTSPTAFTFLGTGSGTNAAAPGDVALQTENNSNGFVRAAAAVTRATTNFANDTLQLVETRTATGAVTVAEVGVFNAISAGTMLGRKVITPRVYASTDQLTVTYSITII